MASALSSQMSGQIEGWPAAIRVMSRKPPAASCSRAACSSPRSAARSIRVAAVRWGTWETTATSASCCVGIEGHHVGPEVGQDAAEPGVGAPGRSPRSGSAPRWPRRRDRPRPRRRPTCSEPAIGWPPTKRGWSIAATSGPFTLAHVGDDGVGSQAGRGEDPGDHLGGDVDRGGHHDQVGLRGRSPSASRAPSSTARAADARRRRPSRSPCQPRSRRAIPTEPPMSPVPKIMARPARRSPSDRRPRAGASVGEVVTESLGALEVDVVDLVPRALGGDVEHDPDAAGHRPDDGQLAGTDQRHGARAPWSGRRWPGRSTRCPRWR